MATSRRSASRVSPEASRTRTPRRGRLDALGSGLDENADPVVLEPLGEQRAGLGIEAREQMGVVLDERDLRAHPPEELRELHTHRATAEDDETLGDRACPDRLAIRPVLDVSEPVDGRNGGFGSGRDDELVVLELALADRDDTRAEHASIAAHELGSLLLEPVRVPRVVPPVGHLIAPPEDALDVDLARHRLRGSGGQPGGSEGLGRP